MLLYIIIILIIVFLNIQYYSREDLLQTWVKDDLTVEYSVIFQVIISISNLMTSQQLLKDDMNNKEPRQVEMVAAVLLVDAVLEDACYWVRIIYLHFRVPPNN